MKLTNIKMELIEDHKSLKKTRKHNTSIVYSMFFLGLRPNKIKIKIKWSNLGVVRNTDLLVAFLLDMVSLPDIIVLTFASFYY